MKADIVIVDIIISKIHAIMPSIPPFLKPLHNQYPATMHNMLIINEVKLRIDRMVPIVGPKTGIPIPIISKLPAMPSIPKI